MISAKEAQEKAMVQIGSKTSEELTVCEKAITDAVSKGELSCWVYMGLGKQTTTKLRQLGYDVKNQSSSKEGSMYLISWKLDVRKIDT